MWGLVKGIPLFTPANPAAFNNPANYIQNYHLLATDKSVTEVPQFRVDLIHEADGDGFGYRAGFIHKETKQRFSYNELRLNAVTGANISLAQAGALNGSITPFDSNGLQLLFVDPSAVAAYVAAHPGSYVLNNSVARNTLNNFLLDETLDGGYARPRTARARSMCRAACATNGPRTRSPTTCRARSPARPTSPPCGPTATTTSRSPR